jgi:hypothetical protein
MRLRLHGTPAECAVAAAGLRRIPGLHIVDQSRLYPDRSGGLVRIYLTACLDSTSRGDWPGHRVGAGGEPTVSGCLECDVDHHLACPLLGEEDDGFDADEDGWYSVPLLLWPGRRQPPDPGGQVRGVRPGAAPPRLEPTRRPGQQPEGSG